MHLVLTHKGLVQRLVGSRGSKGQPGRWSARPPSPSGAFSHPALHPVSLPPTCTSAPWDWAVSPLSLCGSLAQMALCPLVPTLQPERVPGAEPRVASPWSLQACFLLQGVPPSLLWLLTR